MDYLSEMFSLEGKTVLVTGGAGAIAGSMAGALLQAGARLVLWDYQAEPLEALAHRLTSGHTTNGRVVTLQVDTTDEQAVAEALARTEELAGIPNVLINAVGGNRGKCAFTDLVVEDFEAVLRLNITAGLVIPTKHMARLWIEKKRKGAIINIASMASYVPLSGIWAYNASKAAVKTLTMATAKEFAPHGIRVNAIAPGFFIGKQNKALLIRDEAAGELTERGRDVIAHTPFGRFGELHELNGVTLFLASEQAAGFVTGVTIPVDGGYLVQNI